MTFPNDRDPNSSSYPGHSQFDDASEQPRRFFPPQPPRFWQIVLKDMATTIVGVGFFCLCAFVLVLSSLAVLGKALSDIDPTTKGFTETTIRGSSGCASKVVVLPIEGVIETDEMGFIPEAIEAIKDDGKVRALVLRVNSPGGTLSGSDYYLHLLKKLKAELEIPVIVSMGDMAASGGYYISTIGDKIFAERSTTTGSIGVIVSMYNAAELCKKIGVRSSSITSGAMKGMGDFMKEPTPEETAIWQKYVDDSYEQFLSVVKEGRPWFRGEENAPVVAKAKHKQVAGVKVKTVKEGSDEDADVEEETAEVVEEPVEESADQAENAEAAESAETPDAAEDAEVEAYVPETKAEVELDVVAERDAALRQLADGRIYSAADALELHLIDEIGFLDDAIDAAIKAADLVENDVEVVRYEEEAGLFDSLLHSQAKEQPMNQATDAIKNTIETIATPRVYLMCPRALP